MLKQRHSLLFILLALFAPLPGAFLSGCGGNAKKEIVAKPLELQVVAVEKRDVPLGREFVGHTLGSIDADVRARVEGVVTGVFFEEGKQVTEGQLLYTIDSAPFDAKVAEAAAGLAETKTKLVQAESDYRRIKPLADIDAVSKRELDFSTASLGVAQNAVKAAEAQLDQAKIQLSYTRITAPTSGVIGISRAKVGEFVGRPPNPSILNTVSKLDPIMVEFTLNEKDYLYFARLATDTGADSGGERKKRELALILADGSVFSQKGTVAKVDRQIDVQTGAITLQASFPNPGQLLRPGLFAKVQTVAETRLGALLVPKKALGELQGKFQLFVVDSGGQVQQRMVEVGPEFGELRVIESGVVEGELVAVEGIQRLRSGQHVVPNVVQNSTEKS